MLIQRRPGASTISTRGSSRSGVRSAARDRAARRPKGDRGRLGMARTERLVGRRHHHIRILRVLPISLVRRRDRLLRSRPHSSTHPEGWRDWPVDTPPTISRKRETVAIPSGSNDWPGRCGQASPSLDASATHPAGGFPDMPADALKCKECSTTYPLDARYVCERCFGPLEVAYRPSDASPEELKRRIQAGPHTLWRYADFLPLERSTRSALPTGWTPLVKADRLAERLGLGELYIKNETANPTHSFKDRVVSIALP